MMSYDVLHGRMYEGLKLMLEAYSTVSPYTPLDLSRKSTYYLITNADIQSGRVGTNSSTFVGQFNIDFMTNKDKSLFIRDQKSKLMEILNDNNHYAVGATTYYFNGNIISVLDAEEEDPFAFRIVYEITHEKVS